MARRQSLIVLGIAVFLGLIAVYLANVYLSSAEQEQASDLRTAKVAVARVPLAFGTPVTPDKVQLVDFPASSVPPGAFATLAQLNAGGGPQVVLRPMEVGEPILKSKLAGEGGRATLSALLPPDMRAVSIRITDVSGVSGFVLPADRVDVMLTRTVGQGENSNRQTDVLLQDARVIAIDQDANDAADKPAVAKTATLEVSQYDAQKLALAQEVGTLSLALRSAKAAAGPELATRVSAADLGRGGYVQRASYAPVPYARAIRRSSTVRKPATAAAPRPASPPAPTTRNVEIVRGTSGSSYDVGGYRGN